MLHKHASVGSSFRAQASVDHQAVKLELLSWTQMRQGL